MALVDALLKIEDANGNLKKITIAEENYLAYQAGIQLGQAGLSKVASLNTGGGTTVGTYDDTSFDGAVGSTTITTTTVSTTLYQINGIAPEDPPFVKPMIWKESASQVEAADDTELDTIVDRLLPIIFTNDYPGTYQLATSSPGGDYTEIYGPLFTDTRTDGTTVDYNLYRRQSYTPPTVVQTLKLEGTNGDLKPMTKEEMRTTFGQRAKTRIMATGIGTYQFRTSVQGAPTDPGTWVAKGTAVDTKQQTADVDYSRDSTINYLISYGRSYVGAEYTGAEYLKPSYARNYLSDDYIGFTGDYTPNYTGKAQYLGNYIPNYDNYIGPAFTGSRTGYISDYYSEVNLIALYSIIAGYDPAAVPGLQYYGGTYVQEFDPGKQKTFGASYLSPLEYMSVYGGDRDETIYSGYQGAFGTNPGAINVNDFLGLYIRTFAVDVDYLPVPFQGNYADYAVDVLQYIGNYTLSYDLSYIANYDNAYGSDYTGNYIGNFLGETIQPGSETIETYTLYVRVA